MSLDRFATALDIKQVSEQRIISGHAAAWALDRVGDVIDQKAFDRTLREKQPSDVAVFIGHQSDELPVGIPVTLRTDERGLYTEVKVFDGPAGDNLLAVARGLRAAGQTLGLSIGFRVRDSKMERLGNKSIRRLLDIDLVEFSYAARQTIANPAALMTNVKAGASMGFTVEQRGGKYHAIRTSDGKDMGGFDTEAAAKAACDMMAGDGKMIDVNDLPDSAFLVIESGGALDEGGRTVPRAKRHFPYRDNDGQIDPTAVKLAIAAIPDAKALGLTTGELHRLQARAHALLEAAGHVSVKTVDADAPEWRAGAPAAIRGVGYRLIDLSEQIATELKAMALLGEDTKSGQRLRAEKRSDLLAFANELKEIAELAERATKGEDDRALLALYEAEIELLGV